MLKILAIVFVILGVLIWPPGSNAFDTVPLIGKKVIVSNFCYDTPKYFEEVNKLNKDLGTEAAKKRYWEIMSTKETACHANIQWPVKFVKLAGETINLQTLYGRCFDSQIWEIEPILGPSSNRKMYSVWHVGCNV